MKEYGELLGTRTPRLRGRACATSARCRIGPARAHAAQVAAAVVYHDACHWRTQWHSVSRPAEGKLLRAIPGLESARGRRRARDLLRFCRGLQPAATDAAGELGLARPATCSDTGPDAIAAGNPGCAAQLDFHLRRLGRPLPIHHPVELVLRSIDAGAR